MLINTDQEKNDLKGLKNKALKSKKKNDQYEKGKVFEAVPNSIGNLAILVK